MSGTMTKKPSGSTAVCKIEKLPPAPPPPPTSPPHLNRPQNSSCFLFYIFLFCLEENVLFAWCPLSSYPNTLHIHFSIRLSFPFCHVSCQPFSCPVSSILIINNNYKKSYIKCTQLKEIYIFLMLKLNRNFSGVFSMCLWIRVMSRKLALKRYRDVNEGKYLY